MRDFLLSLTAAAALLVGVLVTANTADAQRWRGGYYGGGYYGGYYRPYYGGYNRPYYDAYSSPYYYGSYSFPQNYGYGNRYPAYYYGGYGYPSYYYSAPGVRVGAAP